MSDEKREGESPVDSGVTKNVSIKPTSSSAPADAKSHKNDNKKEKCKPMTKVVIRRLPSTMTHNQFIEQVSPLPDYDYLYFVKADMSLGQYAYSRAYVNFLHQEDVFMFREKFDNYVFVDGKGTEYPAVVEFAPFQRLPKKRLGKKKDSKCGTIDTDPYYISFIESLKSHETEVANSQPKTEYSYQPFDNAQKRVTTTPLLEYLKQRKLEKQKMRDEKREERRRKDIERRRARDEMNISKVLKNPDADRDWNRDNKENKDEKEKSLKECKNRKRDDNKPRDKILITRDRDSKGSGGKNYKDREERRSERDNKYGKKQENKKVYSKKEDGKSEDKRNTAKSLESKEEKKEKVCEEKKGKSYGKMRLEKKRLSEFKKQGNPEEIPDETPKECQVKEEIKTNENVEIPIVQEKPEVETVAEIIPKKSNEDIDSVAENLLKNCSIFQRGQESSDISSDTNTNYRPTRTKIFKRRSSLESGEGNSTEADENSLNLRRHKSLDGGDDENFQKNENDYKHKDKKDPRDPRVERRIRNKDRPAMEIYRPGMGKFSKQRIEREKSSNDDRQSPTSFSTELKSMTFKRSISHDIVT